MSMRRSSAQTIRLLAACVSSGALRGVAGADNVGTGDRRHLGHPRHAFESSIAGSSLEIACVSVGAAGDIVRATRGHGEGAAAESTCHQ
jgi:hypothetical protein